MKKAFYCLCLFVCFSFLPQAVSAESTDVGNFEEFNAAVGSSSTTVDIALSDNITVSGELNIQNADELYIEGNNYFINGNDFGTSFKLGEGQKIIFSTVTVSSFNIIVENSGGNVSGGVINSSGAVEIINTTFSSNSVTSSNLTGDAFASGGSVYNDGGSVLAGNALLYGNEAVAISSTGAANASGGAIYNSSGTLEVSYSILDSNAAKAESVDDKAYAFGGAIYNTASSDTVSLISESIVKNNYAYAESSSVAGGYVATRAFGGAVYNSEGTFYITKSTFTDNSVVSKADRVGDSESHGGAVYSEGKTVITDTDFSNNYASSTVSDNGATAGSYGGAVFSDGELEIYGGKFENNSAYADGGVSPSGYGGAVYSQVFANISDSLFSGNSVDAFSDNGYVVVAGGALLASGITKIEKSVFSNNSANAQTNSGISDASGGAISNNGVMTIYDSNFFYNSATDSSGDAAYGGAIFNRGILNIISISTDSLFTGNTANGISNAIYNEDSSTILNLNAAGGGSVIFNDSIAGDNGTININQTGTWDVSANPYAPDGNMLSTDVPVSGVISFNNSVTGNDINLYNSGTLKLGAFDGVEDTENPGSYIVDPSRGSIGTASSRNNFTINDTAVFDMANGMADDIVYINNFTVTGTPVIKMDVDLANLKWDTLDISGVTSGSGKLDLSKLRITSGFTGGITSKDIGIFVNTPTEDYLAGTDFYTYNMNGNGKYHVTEGSDYASLNILFAGNVEDIFQDAVLQHGNRTIVLADSYILQEGFNNTVSSGTLMVDGNSEEVQIDGNAISNIFVLDRQDARLELSNISITNGASNEGGAVFNAGEIDMSSVLLYGNTASSATVAKGGAVFNSVDGLLDVSFSSFTGNFAYVMKEAEDAQNDIYMYSYGGGVYNSDIFDVKGSSFTGNYARTKISISTDTVEKDVSGYSYGGAVYNEAAFTADNTYFNGNYALSESYGDSMNAFAYGGAVYNDSILNINSSLFENNYASATVSVQSSTAAAYGGAVYTNLDSVSNIINSSFIGNFATAFSSGTGNTSAYGGAVYNDGVTNVYNSSFVNNEVKSDNGTAQGGAVFNASGATLNIIADGGDVEFTGNTAGGKSNAVHNAGNAEMNLNANTSDSIIFNDAITGDNGMININQIGDWDSVANPSAPDGNKIPLSAPATGTIVFNNSVNGNDIVLHGGTLRLGLFEGGTYYGKKVAASRGSIGTDSQRNDLTIIGSSVLDIANGSAEDVIYVNDFIVNGASKLNVEVDLANSKWDRIDAAGVTSGAGTLDISDLKILSDFTSGVSLDAAIFTNPTTSDYFQDPDFYIYRYNTEISSSIYHITQTADYGTLNILLEGYSDDTFQDAIRDSAPARVLQLESNYYTASTYNPVIEAGTLTIRGGDAKGNAVTIDGAGVNEIFVLQDDTVELQASNVILKSGYAQQGGAVYNAGAVLLSGVTFSSNVAQSSITASYGGAVYNAGSFIAKNVVFSSNVAQSTFTAAQGGALYNASTASIYNTSFIDNSASGNNASGGAIYNQGVLNIIADGGNVEFSGNTANGVSNAIHNAGGAVLNLNAGSGIITLSDSITSEGDNNMININSPLDIETGGLDSMSLSPAPVSGTVIINADMTNFGNLNSSSGNAVNMYNGTLKLGGNAVFFNNVEFNMFAGTAFDMTNSKIDTVSVNGFNLPDGNVDVSIDVDLRNSKADNFVGTKLIDNTGTLTIKNILLWNDVSNLEKHVKILIADDENLKNALLLDDSVKKVMAPIFIYDVSYGNGTLGFEYTGDYNPSIFIAPISMKIGGYLGQLNAYNQAFDIMHDTVNGHYRKGLWVKPYGYEEDIELNDKLTVSNTAYGAFFGYDTKMSDVGRNFEGNFSIYGAFNASSLKYDGAEINQDGGMFGVTAAIYKENFFTALTANVGIISEHGKGSHGKDDFMMYTKGIASKTGYNFVLDYDEKLKLQPTFNVSCSSIDMDSYLNGAGVKINSGGMVPINIEPAVSFVADLKNDLMTFVNLSMSWNIFDNSDFTADDVTLPDLDIDPYVQYGIGFSKALGESFSTRAEVYGRSLGRSGYGGQLNLRWAF